MMFCYTDDISTSVKGKHLKEIIEKLKEDADILLVKLIGVNKGRHVTLKF